MNAVNPIISENCAGGLSGSRRPQIKSPVGIPNPKYHIQRDDMRMEGRAALAVVVVEAVAAAVAAADDAVVPVTPAVAAAPLPVCCACIKRDACSLRAARRAALSCLVMDVGRRTAFIRLVLLLEVKLLVVLNGWCRCRDRRRRAA
jgi:hypothetical protein